MSATPWTSLHRVATGTVLSVGALRRRVLPGWLGRLGVVAGVVAILRPAIVTQVPAFIATMQPLLLWLAAVSVVLARSSGTSPSS